VSKQGLAESGIIIKGRTETTTTTAAATTKASPCDLSPSLLIKPSPSPPPPLLGPLLPVSLSPSESHKATIVCRLTKTSGHCSPISAIPNHVEASSLRSTQLLLLCHHTTVDQSTSAALITGPSHDGLGIRLGRTEASKHNIIPTALIPPSLPRLIACHSSGVRGATKGLGALDEARTRLDPITSTKTTPPPSPSTL
jgi:hypothetical protein